MDKKPKLNTELKSVDILRETIYTKELQALIVLLSMNSLFAGFMLNYLWWLPFHDLIFIAEVMFFIGIMTAARAIMYLPEYVESRFNKDKSKSAEAQFATLEMQQNRRAFLPLFSFISGILLICSKLILIAS